MRKRPIRNTKKYNNGKLKKLLDKGAALLLTVVMIFNLVPVTGYADSSYVPTVTQIPANTRYTDAVGQTLVDINGYDKEGAQVQYILSTNGFYVEPVFKHGMDPNFTITVQVTFNDWLDATTRIAFENRGWRMGINLKQWEKDFHFNFTDSPVVHLPEVSFTDTEFVWPLYQTKSLPYNGNQQTLVNVGSFDAAYGTVTVEHQKEKDAGVYPVKVIVNLNDGIYATDSSKSGGSNETVLLGRTWQESADKKTYTKAFDVTIAKANLNISTTNGSIIPGAATSYTPAELIAASGASVTANGVGNDGAIACDIVYTWADGSTVSKAVTVGDHKINAAVTPHDSNYNSAQKEITVKVKQNVVAAAVLSNDLVYNGEAQNLVSAVNFTANGTAVTVPASSYTISYKKDGIDCAQPTDAGEYTAYLSMTDSSAYILASQPVELGKVKILPKTVTAQAVTKVYDGSASSDLTLALNDVAEKDKNNVTATATATFSSKNVGSYSDVTLSDVAIGGAASGNYSWDGANATVSGTITKCPVTVKAKDTAKTYGEADPVLEYTASGIVPGETLADINLSRENGNDAGTYTITASQTEGANPNYDITFENGVFTINPKEIDINWGPVSALAYTGSSLVPSPVVTNLENGDDCVLTAAVVETADGAGIIPGIWTAKITSLSNPNYKLPADEAKSQVAFEIVNASQDNVPAAIAFPETIRSKADGRITNVDSTMEYRKDSENSYTAVSGSEISDLESGTYYIRYAAKQYYNPSADQTVIVYAGRMLDVTVPSVQEGYTLTSDKAEAFWNDSATITFALADGYSKTSDFAVKVNGTPVALDSNGQLAITGIQEDKTITVEGVADITAPSASIRIDSKEWTTLQDTVTQQHFYNTAQTVTVTAADVNLDKVYYHIADTAVTAADITDWTEYTDSIAVNANGNYIVYVKATDTKGNVAYINSDIIVYDDIAPVISGITDGATYYTTQKFIVTDVNTDTVTVNGTPVTDYTFAGNTDKEYIIAATDKAGNSTTVTVQMKPLSTLSGDIEDVSAENITDAVIENLENVKELLENEMSSEVTTASEKTEAQGILDKISTLADNITVDYKIIHGADSNWTQGSASTLGFTANGVFSLFKEVRIADAQGTRTTLVRDAEYTAQSGSTIVTLKQSYLDTLAVGQYKLEVVYDILGTEHIADCNFTVKAKPAPTPAPTATPEPTPTPAATKKPAAKVTAKPTATPEPTETPVEEKETETGTTTETEIGDGQQDETETITPQVPAESTSFPILPVIIAVATIAAVMIIIIILKKKKEDEE